MGVPRFFRWLVEHYPNILEPLREDVCVDCLYLDMNGMVHQSIPNATSIDHMLELTVEYIAMIVKRVQPRALLYMAFDGVAPRAKMNQQRSRRFRSAEDSRVAREEAVRAAGNHGVQDLSKKFRFDRNAITPGTEFMVELNKKVVAFIQKQQQHDPVWQKFVVIFSGPDQAGEGEHKLIDYIRQSKSQVEFDANTSHCFYGLDADLIMLALVSHELRVCLLREEVTFSNTKEQTVPNWKRVLGRKPPFHMLHINLLREYLALEFQFVKPSSLVAGDGSTTSAVAPFDPKRNDVDVERVIDDFLLLCALVGNDFLPHLPFHDMQGLDGILNAYKSYLICRIIAPAAASAATSKTDESERSAQDQLETIYLTFACGRIHFPNLLRFFNLALPYELNHCAENILSTRRYDLGLLRLCGGEISDAPKELQHLMRTKHDKSPVQTLGEIRKKWYGVKFGIKVSATSLDEGGAAPRPPSRADESASGGATATYEDTTIKNKFFDEHRVAAAANWLPVLRTIGKTSFDKIPKTSLNFLQSGLTLGKESATVNGAGKVAGKTTLSGEPVADESPAALSTASSVVPAGMADNEDDLLALGAAMACMGLGDSDGDEANLFNESEDEQVLPNRIGGKQNDKAKKNKKTTENCNDEEAVMQVCEDFLKGLQWVMYYYFRGPNRSGWKYFYPHFHAPMMVDLYRYLQMKLCGGGTRTTTACHSSSTSTSTSTAPPVPPATLEWPLPAAAIAALHRLDENEAAAGESAVPDLFLREQDMDPSKDGPVSPFTQLLSVLPAASKQLLPAEFQLYFAKMPEFYPSFFLVDIDGVKVSYGGVTLVPFIDPHRLDGMLKAPLNKLHATAEALVAAGATSANSIPAAAVAKVFGSVPNGREKAQLALLAAARDKTVGKSYCFFVNQVPKGLAPQVEKKRRAERVDHSSKELPRAADAAAGAEEPFFLPADAVFMLMTRLLALAAQSDVFKTEQDVEMLQDAAVLFIAKQQEERKSWRAHFSAPATAQGSGGENGGRGLPAQVPKCKTPLRLLEEFQEENDLHHDEAQMVNARATGTTANRSFRFECLHPELPTGMRHFVNRPLEVAEDQVEGEKDTGRPPTVLVGSSSLHRLKVTGWAKKKGIAVFANQPARWPGMHLNLEGVYGMNYKKDPAGPASASKKPRFTADFVAALLKSSARGESVSDQALQAHLQETATTAKATSSTTGKKGTDHDDGTNASTSTSAHLLHEICYVDFPFPRLGVVTAVKDLQSVQAAATSEEGRKKCASTFMADLKYVQWFIETHGIATTEHEPGRAGKDGVEWAKQRKVAMVRLIDPKTGAVETEAGQERPRLVELVKPVPEEAWTRDPALENVSRVDVLGQIGVGATATSPSAGAGPVTPAPERALALFSGGVTRRVSQQIPFGTGDHREAPAYCFLQGLRAAITDCADTFAGVSPKLFDLFLVSDKNGGGSFSTPEGCATALNAVSLVAVLLKLSTLVSPPRGCDPLLSGGNGKYWKQLLKFADCDLNLDSIATLFDAKFCSTASAGGRLSNAAESTHSLKYVYVHQAGSAGRSSQIPCSARPSISSVGFSPRPSIPLGAVGTLTQACTATEGGLALPPEKQEVCFSWSASFEASASVRQREQQVREVVMSAAERADNKNSAFVAVATQAGVSPTVSRDTWLRQMNLKKFFMEDACDVYTVCTLLESLYISSGSARGSWDSCTENVGLNLSWFPSTGGWWPPADDGSAGGGGGSTTTSVSKPKQGCEVETLMWILPHHVRAATDNPRAEKANITYSKKVGEKLYRYWELFPEVVEYLDGAIQAIRRKIAEGQEWELVADSGKGKGKAQGKKGRKGQGKKGAGFHASMIPGQTPKTALRGEDVFRKTKPEDVKIGDHVQARMAALLKWLEEDNFRADFIPYRSDLLPKSTIAKIEDVLNGDYVNTRGGGFDQHSSPESSKSTNGLMPPGDHRRASIVSLHSPSGGLPQTPLRLPPPASIATKISAAAAAVVAASESAARVEVSTEMRTASMPFSADGEVMVGPLCPKPKRPRGFFLGQRVAICNAALLPFGTSGLVVGIYYASTTSCCSPTEAGSGSGSKVFSHKIAYLDVLLERKVPDTPAAMKPEEGNEVYPPSAGGQRSRNDEEQWHQHHRARQPREKVLVPPEDVLPVNQLAWATPSAFMSGLPATGCYATTASSTPKPQKGAGGGGAGGPSNGGPPKSGSLFEDAKNVNLSNGSASGNAANGSGSSNVDSGEQSTSGNVGRHAPPPRSEALESALRTLLSGGKLELALEDDDAFSEMRAKRLAMSSSRRAITEEKQPESPSRPAPAEQEGQEEGSARPPRTPDARRLGGGTSSTTSIVAVAPAMMSADKNKGTDHRPAALRDENRGDKGDDERPERIKKSKPRDAAEGGGGGADVLPQQKEPAALAGADVVVRGGGTPSVRFLEERSVEREVKAGTTLLHAGRNFEYCSVGRPSCPSPSGRPSCPSGLRDSFQIIPFSAPSSGLSTESEQQEQQNTIEDKDSSCSLVALSRVLGKEQVEEKQVESQVDKGEADLQEQEDAQDDGDDVDGVESVAESVATAPGHCNHEFAPENRLEPVARDYRRSRTYSDRRQVLERSISLVSSPPSCGVRVTPAVGAEDYDYSDVSAALPQEDGENVEAILGGQTWTGAEMGEQLQPDVRPEADPSCALGCEDELLALTGKQPSESEVRHSLESASRSIPSLSSCADPASISSVPLRRPLTRMSRENVGGWTLEPNCAAASGINVNQSIN